MIYFHDCIYRNLNKYKYVSLLGKKLILLFYYFCLFVINRKNLCGEDIDEVIVPRTLNTWPELAEILEKEHSPEYNHYDTFVFNNVFMTDTMLDNHINEKETKDLLKGVK